MHENIDSSNFLPCGKLRGLCTAGVGPQDKQLNTYGKQRYYRFGGGAV